MKNKKKLFLSVISGFLAVILLQGAVPNLRPTTVMAASSSEIKEEIDELKEEEKKLEEEKKALKSQIKDNMGEMERLVAEKNVLDQEIFILKEQVGNINQQIQAYGLLISDKQDELEAAQERLELLTQKNKDRIRAMEMYGEMSYWSVLAQAGSFSEFLDRLSMVAEIAEADERRLKEMKEAAENVAAAQAILETEKAALEDVRKGLNAAEQELLAKREQADALLQEMIARGEEFNQLLDAAEQKTEELQDEIAAAQDAYDEAKHQEYLQWLSTSVPPTTTKHPSYGNDAPPSSGAGGWVRPLSSYRVSSPYGNRVHPVYGTVRFHGGIDLAAPQGSPIYAARGGTVTAAGYSSSNGYYVTISHDNEFSTAYLHMTHYTVKVGQKVSAGQKIGEVGSTGVSTGPHLHFSMYYNGKTVNPANYISF